MKIDFTIRMVKSLEMIELRMRQRVRGNTFKFANRNGGHTPATISQSNFTLYK